MSQKLHEHVNEESLTLADAELIASPITLPCGRVVRNRLVKVALYEHLAAFGGGPPTRHHISVYSKWSKGRWGMIMTGNCQISPSHLSLGRDITCPLSDISRNLDPFRALSAAIHSDDTSDSYKTLAILQLSHGGRQSPRFIGGRFGRSCKPRAPSSRRVGDDTREGCLARLLYMILFETPLTISSQEIQDVVDGFVTATKTAAETGFDGVQLHASHGYLLSQFLSPKLNTRTDEYSEPLRIIRQIIGQIRSVVAPSFVLGIKVNAGDYVNGGLSVDRALDNIRELALLSVDFIEISGGDYEDPKFVDKPSPRQAFFSSFSRLVVQSLTDSDTSPLIILTGSLRTPSQFCRVLRQKHAHLLGLGRLSVLCPYLPRLISPSSVSRIVYGSELRIPKFPLPEPALSRPRWFPKLMVAGTETAWYIMGIRNIASNREIDLRLGAFGALFWMWFWGGPGPVRL